MIQRSVGDVYVDFFLLGKILTGPPINMIQLGEKENFFLPQLQPYFSREKSQREQKFFIWSQQFW